MRGKLSSSLITAEIILFSIFLLSGGVYCFFDDRAIFETILVMMLYGVGTFGLFLSYESTKYLTNPHRGYSMLFAGISFLIAAYIMIEWILSVKMRV